MTNVTPIQPLKCRTAWLSDIHLGYPGCKTEFLLDFLQQLECDYLYLVGDIIDVSYMQQKGLYWPRSHSDVVSAILDKARHKTKVVYIPGNHDEIFREYDGSTFAKVEIQNKCIHYTADGRKLLMMHGDEFDNDVISNRLVSFIGDKSNDFLLYLNRHLYTFHRKMGFSYRSVSAYVKGKVKNAANVMAKFRGAIVNEAKRAEVDGIVCGHQHHAQIREIDGILYCNDGDWVENCTTMIEHHDGTLELLRWREEVTSLSVHPPKHTEMPERKVA